MEERFEGYVEEVNEELDVLSDEISPPRLSRAVSHISLSGGKRLRPVLTLLACESVGGERSDALRRAIAVEMIHTSALVADDIIDRSTIRRGVSTIHEKYGHEMAVLSSNILLGKAFEIIDDKRSVQVMTRAVRLLGEGEALELATDLETVDEYLNLAHKKTGSLFVASCKLGGIAGDGTEDEIEALGEFGKHLGIAFQIRDDVLDFTASSEDLGKPVGKDALLDRPSLVVIHSRKNGSDLIDSVNFAREIATERIEKARDSLEELESNPHSDELKDIAEFVIERTK